MRRFLVLVLLVACSPSETESPDGGSPMDAGFDAGRDANVVVSDSGQDSGVDAGTDSGPACECSSGPCCDGCNFRPANTPCGVEHVAHNDLCTVAPGGANYPKMSNLLRDFHALRCSGSASTCPSTSAETFQVYLDCIDACPSAGNCTTGCLTADNDLASIDCWGPASCTPGDTDFMSFGICGGAAWPHP